jgi:hypothetical protein
MYIDEPANDTGAVAQRTRTATAVTPTVSGQVIALAQSVGSGQVSLDPETGEQLRKMLVEQTDQVDSWLERAGGLARPALLGSNPVGDAMAGKFEARADGDPLSFVSVMSAYRDVLQQTHDAVIDAIRNFQGVDAEHGAGLTRLQG